MVRNACWILKSSVHSCMCAPTQQSWATNKKTTTKHFIRYSACSSTFSPLVRIDYAIMRWSQRQKSGNAYAQYFIFSSFSVFFLLSSISPSYAELKYTSTHTKTQKGRPSIHEIAYTLCKPCKRLSFSDANYPALPFHLLQTENHFLPPFLGYY